MKTLDTTQDAIGGVAGSLGHVVADGADLAADIVSDLADVAADVTEAAIDTVAATSRVGVRVVSRTIGFIGRHPREVVGGVVAIAGVMAVLRYLKSRSADSSAH